MSTFSDWIIDKISRYLKAKEGCEVSQTENLHDVTRIIVQDAFGFRYEVSVKLLSRINYDSHLVDEKIVSYERRG